MRFNCSMKVRYALLLMFLLASGLAAALITTDDDTTIEVNNDYIKKLIESEFPYHIRTIGCSIPGLKPYDASIKKFVGPPSQLKPCANFNTTLLSNNETHIWINEKNYKYYSILDEKLFTCYYVSTAIAELYKIKYEKRRTYFSKIIKAKDIDEFAKVTCKYKGQVIYNQFYLFAIKKPLTLNKEKSKHKSAYNVIVLGIDAVSRMNFHRTMPKTLAYLKDKGAIELLGYNIVGKTTSSNVIPILCGMSHKDFKKQCSHNESCATNTYIWESFNDAGFYTALGEDSDVLNTFAYKKYLRNITVDYFLYPFMHKSQSIVGNNKDFSSNLCMGNKYYFRVLLDYIENLTSILRSSKLFGFFWESSMSHDNLNYPKAMDKSYEALIKTLHSSHYLDKTILIILSSHGLQWGKIRGTKQGRLEERLPLAYFLMPQSFRETYNLAFRNLKVNSRRLVTAFDIHATLKDLTNLDLITKNEIKIRIKRLDYAFGRSISLFLPLPFDRTCLMADIEKHLCTCHAERVLPIGNKDMKGAAEYLLRHLNLLLLGHSECARLSLSSIQNVTELTVGIPDTNEDGWRDYTVQVLTGPAGAIFKTTMRKPVYGIATGNWSIVGAIGRLNRNPDQSRCIQDIRLKPYCICNTHRLYKP